MKNQITKAKWLSRIAFASLLISLIIEFYFGEENTVAIGFMIIFYLVTGMLISAVHRLKS